MALPSVLISTSNNYVIRRRAANDYVLSLDAGRSGATVASVHPAIYYDTGRVTVIPYATANYLAWYSTNGGKTWTQRVDNGFYPTSVYKTDQQYMWNVGDDGAIYVLGADGWFYSSYDDGQTFSQVFQVSSAFSIGAGDRNIYISDGYVWSLANYDTLEACDTGGSPVGVGHWALPNSTGLLKTAANQEIDPADSNLVSPTPNVQLVDFDGTTDITAAADATYRVRGTIWINYNTLTDINSIQIDVLLNGASVHTITDTISSPQHKSYSFDFSQALSAGDVLQVQVTNTSSGVADDSNLFVEGTNSARHSTFGILHPLPDVLVGWPTTTRLVAWRLLEHWGILSININTPSAPVFSWTADNVFGPYDDATGEGWLVYDIAVIDHDTLVALAVHRTAGGDYDEGAIWQSTDGGASWTQVVAPTVDLAGSTPANRSFVSLIAQDPQNPNEVWLVMTPSLVWHSSDGGATWSTETVDMSIFSGDDPVAWAAVSVAYSAVQQFMPFIGVVA